jgi:predicted nucleic acid-binding protein
VWYAAADAGDSKNNRARELLSAGESLITTDHILVETWSLLRWRLHREAADAFWRGLRSGVASIECVADADLEAAWTIGRDFPDQDFSLVDRTSFAVMVRLGLVRTATFDDDFAVFRYGPRRTTGFTVVR